MSNKVCGDDTKLLELQFIVSLTVILCLLHGIIPADDLQAHGQIDTLTQTCKVSCKWSAAKDFRSFFADRRCLFID